MYVDKLTLHGFKCFEEAHTGFVLDDSGDVLPRVTILLGSNGGGKSTVLRAIALTMVRRGEWSRRILLTRRRFLRGGARGTSEWRASLRTTSPNQLRRLIDAERATWLPRAEQATQALFINGPEKPSGPNWTEIKGVFMEIQHSKCIFCERGLTGIAYGKIEHDVEHFRPKGSVGLWPTEGITRTRGLTYDFPLGDPDPTGYYLLTYDPHNYATSCKTCNSTMKGSYFPIAGTRALTKTDAIELDRKLDRKEEPYLVLPIGDRGQDPEAILRFTGVVAVPRYRTGHRYRRARVIIDLFGLNEREELLVDRARMITHLFLAYAHATNPMGVLVREGRAVMRAMMHESAPHANCARCYGRMLEEDPVGAREVFDAAWEYVGVGEGAWRLVGRLARLIIGIASPAFVALTPDLPLDRAFRIISR
ncbi:MAG: hypothetical protein ACNA8W_14955 [Bradymonadaceae bacterium]